MRYLLFIVSLLIIQNCWALSPQAIILNNQATEKMKEEQYAEAQKDLLTALTLSPKSAEIYLNLGLILEGAQDKERALQAYETALSLSSTPSISFGCLFNAARLYGEKGKIDEALALYQQALELNPESVEVKTNIELLVNQKGQGEGSGKGEEEKKDKNDDKGGGQDNQDKDKKEQKPKDYEDPRKQKPTPRPFKSDQLSKQDLKKILDEVQQQEQQIRDKEYGKQHKEQPRAKDW